MKATCPWIVLAIASASLVAAEPQPDPGDGGGNVAKSAWQTVMQKKVKGFGQLACPSPDGRYAITWPKRDENEVNRLVDLKSGKAIYTIVEGDDRDFESRNHGGLSALWRADSKAVIVKLHSKWSPRAVWLLVIGEDGKVTTDELTGPLRRGLVKIFETQAAEFGRRSSAGFAANLSCEFSDDGKALNITAEGEVNPKQMADQAHIVANLTATFDLASRKLTVTGGKVTEARIVPFQ